MSMLGRVLRFAFLPAIRVGEQLRQSGHRLGAMRQEYLERSRRPGPIADIADGRSMSDAQRFEHLYSTRGWTEPLLHQQLIAVRRTKTAALLGCGLGTVSAVVLLLMAPLWMLVILVPASVGLTSFALAAVLKYALFQAQLERRELISLRAYLCRPDMVQHLLGFARQQNEGTRR